jgi:hypothetical protein
MIALCFLLPGITPRAADSAPFPPLSYSLPTFSEDAYDNVDGILDLLVMQGFQWVTLTPTWVVGQRGFIARLFLPEIGSLDFSQTPSFAKIEAVARAAASRGLNVKIEPHLDWETTFSRDGEDWRRRMYFNPVDVDFGYDDNIIQPLQDIIERVADEFPDVCFALTLGSELDVSLYAFTAGWQEMLETLKARRTIAGLDSPVRREFFGHKINHDTFPEHEGVFRELNRGRADNSLEAISRDEFRARASGQVAAYLGQLDYVSVSFYPIVAFRYPDGGIADDNFWDRTEEDGSVPEADVEAVANTLLGTAQDLKGLFEAAGVDVPLDFGEFGLGNSNPNESFGTDADSLRGRDVMREKFYRGFFKFLMSAGSLTGTDLTEECALPATMWTAGPQYDVMHAFPGLDRTGLPDLRDTVREYNEAFSSQPVAQTTEDDHALSSEHCHVDIERLSVVRENSGLDVVITNACAIPALGEKYSWFFAVDARNSTGNQVFEILITEEHDSVRSNFPEDTDVYMFTVTTGSNQVGLHLSGDTFGETAEIVVDSGSLVTPTGSFVAHPPVSVPVPPQ